jgi:hypothetical protein
MSIPMFGIHDRPYREQEWKGLLDHPRDWPRFREEGLGYNSRFQVYERGATSWVNRTRMILSYITDPTKIDSLSYFTNVSSCSFFRKRMYVAAT